MRAVDVAPFFTIQPRVFILPQQQRRRQRFGDSMPDEDGLGQRFHVWVLLFKKVCMVARSSQLLLTAIDTINQQPIRLNMCIPVVFLTSSKWVIKVVRGQRLLLDQQHQQRF